MKAFIKGFVEGGIVTAIVLFSALVTWSTCTDVSRAAPAKWAAEECYDYLEAKSGLSVGEKRALRTVVQEYQLVEFELALAFAESRFQVGAVSKAGAVGLFQITKVGLKEAQRACPKLDIKMEDLKHPVLNILTFKCYYASVAGSHLKNPMAIVAYVAYHNGGGVQLSNLRQGREIHGETAQLIARTFYNFNQCLIRRGRI